MRLCDDENVCIYDDEIEELQAENKQLRAELEAAKADNVQWSLEYKERVADLRQRLAQAEQIAASYRAENIHVREEIAQAEQRQREFVSRLKLEFDAVACDCGRPWKESDAADLVNEYYLAGGKEKGDG